MYIGVPLFRETTICAEMQAGERHERVIDVDLHGVYAIGRVFGRRQCDVCTYADISIVYWGYLGIMETEWKLL